MGMKPLKKKKTEQCCQTYKLNSSRQKHTVQWSAIHSTLFSNRPKIYVQTRGRETKFHTHTKQQIEVQVLVLLSLSFYIGHLLMSFQKTEFHHIIG